MSFIELSYFDEKFSKLLNVLLESEVYDLETLRTFHKKGSNEFDKELFIDNIVKYVPLLDYNDIKVEVKKESCKIDVNVSFNETASYDMIGRFASIKGRSLEDLLTYLADYEKTLRRMGVNIRRINVSLGIEI